MKTKCSKYTPEDISMFVDNEFFKDQYRTLAQHIEQCSHCNELARQYKTLSDVFHNHVHERQQGLKINKALLEQKFDKIIQSHGQSTWSNIFGLSKKYIFIKFAGVIMISLISLFAFQKIMTKPTGPSAIVKYVDTDYSSVMIIETEKEKHTIIWFNET
jgi:hypothetical protein